MIFNLLYESRPHKLTQTCTENIFFLLKLHTFKIHQQEENKETSSKQQKI